MYREQKKFIINSLFYNHCINKIEETEKESFQDDYFFISSSSYFKDNTSFSSNNEEDNKFQFNYNFFDTPAESLINISKILEVSNQEKDSIFTRIENDELKEIIFCQKKRFPKKRRRRENQDNIRKKIKKGFLNRGLIKKINEILKNNRSVSFFEKFQQHFTDNVTIKANKELMNMTLKEIFEKKELYQEKELKHYEHNLNLVHSKEIQENKKLKNLLNKKLYVIYEDYLNSKEFLIEEINRLRNKNMENEYIERLKYLAKHFIEFFSS
jgi:hypothetical protein